MNCFRLLNYWLCCAVSLQWSHSKTIRFPFIISSIRCNLLISSFSFYGNFKGIDGQFWQFCPIWRVWRVAGYIKYWLTIFLLKFTYILSSYDRVEPVPWHKFLTFSLFQALAKQFALILDFVLAFDDLKVCWFEPGNCLEICYHCIVYYNFVVSWDALDYPGNTVAL